MKKINILLECGRRFQIDLNEVACDRANYYRKKDPDTTFQEEHKFVMEDDYEGIDWLLNNMNWYECKTLQELPTPNECLSDLEIKDVDIL